MKRSFTSSARCRYYGVIFVLSILFFVCGSLATMHDFAFKANAAQHGSPGGRTSSTMLYVLDSRKGNTAGQIIVIDTSDWRITKTLPTGMNPDMALSPDGSRLYIASTYLANKVNREELAIVDTASGTVIQTVSNPNRLFYNIVPPVSAMAMSPGGRWLYVLKMEVIAPANVQYWMETFDTKNDKFLPEKVYLTGCERGTLAPSEQNNQVQVICSHGKEVRLLRVTASGAAASTTVRLEQRNRQRQLNNSDAFDDEDMATAMAASFRTAPDNNLMLMRDGRVLNVDGTARTVAEVALVNLPTDRWVHSAIRTDNGKVIFGLSESFYKGRWVGKQLMLADLSDPTKSVSVATSRPFNYLFLSKDGDRLYAIDTEGAALTIVDAAKLSEIRSLSSVGISPSLVIESP